MGGLRTRMEFLRPTGGRDVFVDDVWGANSYYTAFMR